MRTALYERALAFATKAHGDQKRKYSGEPYITHPVAVAAIVATATDDSEVIAAALLHDVVEDTDVSLAEVLAEFGDYVASLVDELTDKSKPEDGNRAERKKIDRDRLARVSAVAQTIKLADLIHNTDDICKHDEDFAKVYMKEKALLLPFLYRGDTDLFLAACQRLTNYYYPAKIA